MKVLISGGGTGGHVNPALAVANKIRSSSPEAKFLFIGTKERIEAKLVPREGYEIKSVKVLGFQRKLTLKNIDAAIKAVTSVITAKKYIREFAPDVAFGTGGFASWAAIKGAAKLGVPVVIHEQNAYPGVTTRMLSRFASKICISFEESRKYFAPELADRIVYTGNPVKTDTFRYTKAQAKAALGLPSGSFLVLSYGGSMGADAINRYCLGMMERIPQSDNVRFIHATGAIGWERYKQVAEEKGLTKRNDIEICEYIYDMPLKMAAADLVIARAGAITLAELAYLGKAAILIPSPHVAEDHQYKNAQVLEKAGAAVVFKEDECDADILSLRVNELIADVEKRLSLGENIKKFAAADADEKIKQIIVEAAKDKGKKG